MIKEKDKAMIAHVNEWMGSGLSLRDFAQKNGITKGKFAYWVAKVKNANDPMSQPSHFIEISASTDKVNPLCDAHQTLKSSTAQLELTFPSGLVLKIYN